MRGKLIIDGNAFYEIDEECLKNSMNHKKNSSGKGKKSQKGRKNE